MPRMNRLRTLALVTLLFVQPAFPQGTARWFAFNKKFIESHFPQDSAFGSVAATGWAAAGTIHRIECGGEDGELHIGAFNPNIIVNNDEMPVSSPRNENDPGWGIVSEFPNARRGNGPMLFSQATGSITFTGYLRLWNEGHDHGQVNPSNPHHVLEVHPAWAFVSDNSITFDNRALVDVIENSNPNANRRFFGGFGASKFRPMLQDIRDRKIIFAFQDAENVFVQLPQFSNFFQLPVTVRSFKKVTGGHQIVLDVFSDKNHTTLIYSALHGITADDTPIDNALGHSLKTGDQTFLLGFFSINLGKAMELSANAASENGKVSAKRALEFFVFSKAMGPAVSSSSPCVDEEENEP